MGRMLREGAMHKEEKGEKMWNEYSSMNGGDYLNPDEERLEIDSHFCGHYGKPSLKTGKIARKKMKELY